MKISSISVQGFQGIKSAEIVFNKPVQLLCGRNGSGKSTIINGADLALTGNLGRVSLKKEAPALVNDSAKASACEVVEKLENGDERVYGVTITKTGKMVESREAEPDPMLQYLFDAQSFTSLDEKARRAFLFGLMRLRLTPASIAERLAEKGCDKKKLDDITPLLRNGFDGAYTEAKNYATQAKGAWRNVTGETYGEVKAETWRAGVQPVDVELKDPMLLQASRDQLATLDRLVADTNQAVGGLAERKHQREKLLGTLPDLRETAKLMDRRRAKLKNDEDELARVQDLVLAAKGAPRPAKTMACPCCAALLVVEDEKLIEYKVPTAAERSEELTNLPGYERSATMLRNAVANDKRDLDASVSAANEIARIEAMAELTAEEQGQLANAKEKIQGYQTKRAAINSRIGAALDAQRQVDLAEQKTIKAKAAHTDVLEWNAVAVQLSPDGIQAEVVASALSPINARMKQSSVDACWPVVAIEADMAIQAGGRTRPLLSVSEKWRVDAIFAEAVSHISGRKLLVLDGADVLDVKGREQLMGWLDILASMKEIDCALVGMTLKEKPKFIVGVDGVARSPLPDTIEVCWIENGVVVE